MTSLPNSPAPGSDAPAPPAPRGFWRRVRHHLAEPVDAVLEAKIANYLRRIQGAHGGWPLVHDGPFDMSASVKAYFALKMIGDSVDAPHMVKAREAIRSRGGAAGSNVFTRFLLALYGVVTWRAVPVLPVEIMLLPMWSPFHLNKVSYWARTTLVPLMVLATLKPRAKNPKGVGIDELFLQDPESLGLAPKAPHQSWGWFLLFRGIDRILRVIEPLFPKKPRACAIERALAFIEERLNGEDGLGAIYPPMANVVMMYEALGKDENFPPRAITRRGIEKLLVIGEQEKAEGRVTLRSRAGDNLGSLALNDLLERLHAEARMPGQEPAC